MHFKKNMLFSTHDLMLCNKAIHTFYLLQVFAINVWISVNLGEKKTLFWFVAFNKSILRVEIVLLIEGNEILLAKLTI